MNRRKVLSFLLTLFGVTALSSLAYPIIRYLVPIGMKTAVKPVNLNKNEISTGESKSILLDNTPVVIINRPEKGYIAFSKVCTHLGCLVEYNIEQQRLICPCHAGTFSLDGNVISGPPPKPLLQIPLRVEGENIIIG